MKKKCYNGFNNIRFHYWNDTTTATYTIITDTKNSYHPTHHKKSTKDVADCNRETLHKDTKPRQKKKTNTESPPISKLNNARNLPQKTFKIKLSLHKGSYLKNGGIYMWNSYSIATTPPNITPSTKSSISACLIKSNDQNTNEQNYIHQHRDRCVSDTISIIKKSSSDIDLIINSYNHYIENNNYVNTTHNKSDSQVDTNHYLHKTILMRSWIEKKML